MGLVITLQRSDEFIKLMRPFLEYYQLYTLIAEAGMLGIVIYSKKWLAA
jgi:hypothetical protein